MEFVDFLDSSFEAVQVPSYIDDSQSNSPPSVSPIGTTPKSGDEQASSASSSSSSNPQMVAGHQRTRKQHQKSRRGCYNCKKRRIKCTEDQPSCKSCLKSRLTCRYLPQAAIPSPQTAVTLSTEPLFSATDMRLFHHYLTAAYPHYPIRSDNIWLSYITPIGHQKSYLLSALLALSASHLSRLTQGPSSAISNSSSLLAPARHHRLAAIRGLNAILANPEVNIKTAEDGDAVIAVVYSLLMQSWYMDDGLSSWLVMTRSCETAVRSVRERRLGALFVDEGEEDRLGRMRVRLEDAPSFGAKMVREAVRSLEAVRELCTLDVEVTMADLLVEAFTSLSEGAIEAYRAQISLDKTIAGLPSPALHYLLDPTNHVAQLLLAHLVALHLVMRPVACKERKHYTVTMYGIRMTAWIDRLYEGLPGELRGFMNWTMSVSGLHKLGKLEGYTLKKG